MENPDFTCKALGTEHHDFSFFVFFWWSFLSFNIIIETPMAGVEAGFP